MKFHSARPRLLHGSARNELSMADETPPDAPPKKKKRDNREIRRVLQRTKHYEQEVEEGKDGFLYRRVWVDSPEGSTNAAGSDKVPMNVQITDFGLDVRCVHDTEEKRTIKVTITLDGDVKERDMDSKVLERPDLLNAWATDFGGCCNFEKDDMWALKKYMKNQPGWQHVVVTPSFSGYHPDYGVWITQDLAIDSDGVSHTLLAGGSTGDMMCLDGKVREFLVPENVPSTPHVTHYGDPQDVFTWDAEGAQGRMDMHALVNGMRANLGHHGGAFALGWLVAQMVRDEVVEIESVFPHLYVFGARHSGKDTLCRWMTEIAGCGHVPAVSWSGGTSLPYLRNHLSNVSGAPFWINEMRNDEHHKKLMGLIRSTFDNQQGGVSDKRSGTTKEFPVRRGMMLSGQSVLGEEAEFSRYVMVETFKETIVHSELPQVEDNLPKARVAYARLMATRNIWSRGMRKVIEHYKRIFLRNLADFLPEDAHRQRDIELRQAQCWAVTLAGLAFAMLGDPVGRLETRPEGVLDILSPSIIREAFNNALSAKNMSDDMGTRGQFWNVVASMNAEGKLKTRWIAKCIYDGKPAYGIWLSHLCIVVARETRSEDYDQRLMLAELRDTSGFLNNGHNVQFGNSGVYPAVIFRPDSDAIPAFAKRLAERGGKEEAEAEEPGQIAVPM